MITPNENFGGVPVDTGNLFAVVRLGDRVVINGWNHLRVPLTQMQALNLAAWLALMADPSGEQLPKLMARIKEG